MDVDLEARDHTTLSRRSQQLSVDRSGAIVAGVLTDGNADASRTALHLIHQGEANRPSAVEEGIGYHPTEYPLFYMNLGTSAEQRRAEYRCGSRAETEEPRRKG